MQTCTFERTIPKNRHLELTLPEDFPAGVARIIVLTRSKSARPANAGMSLAEFFAWLKEQPATGRSREEIEAQITEERNAWGDE